MFPNFYFFLSCYYFQHAVQQYFHPDQQLSIKDQICQIVRLISNTIHQIYALFYDGHDLLEDDKLKGEILEMLIIYPILVHMNSKL